MKTCSKCSETKPVAEFQRRVASRDGLQPHCKTCAKTYNADNSEKRAEQSAQWRARNHDKVKAYNAEYYAKNSEYYAKRYVENWDKAQVNSAKWKASNREKVNAYQAKWYSANRDKALAAVAKYRAAYPEKVRAAGARWRAENPEAVRIKGHNRRARKRGVGGKLSPGLAERLFRLQRGVCPCCKQSLGDTYHRDHRMPLALGGSNTDDNIQLLCSTCNLSKGAKHPVDFMQQRGFLL